MSASLDGSDDTIDGSDEPLWGQLHLVTTAPAPNALEIDGSSADAAAVRDSVAVAVMSSVRHVPEDGVGVD